MMKYIPGITLTDLNNMSYKEVYEWLETSGEMTKAEQREIDKMTSKMKIPGRR